MVIGECALKMLKKTSTVVTTSGRSSDPCEVVTHVKQAQNLMKSRPQGFLRIFCWSFVELKGIFIMASVENHVNRLIQTVRDQLPRPVSQGSLPSRITRLLPPFAPEAQCVLASVSASPHPNMPLPPLSSSI